MLIPDNSQADPVPLSIFGHFTFLTTQTNLICMLYFACCCLRDTSPAFKTVAYKGFPLCFGTLSLLLLFTSSTHIWKTNTGLGTFLTIAYYALDHYNPESIKRRKYWTRHGYPYCGLNGHLVHFGALPLSILHMISIRPGPSFDDLWYIALYMTFFVCFSVYNRLATGKWQYPILMDVQRSAGFVGCLLFIFFLYVLSLLLFLPSILNTHSLTSYRSLIVGVFGYIGTAGAQHFAGIRRSF